MPQPLKDLTGKTVGRLTIISRAADRVRVDGRRDIYWACRCECGEQFEVRGSHLNAGGNKACKSCSSKGRQGGLKHGMARTTTYTSWEHMNQRCFNPNFKQYKDYGGDGITVCEAWRNFETFHKDMGDRPKGMSLDRIDNDGDYCKENCRWATPSMQTQNRRNVKLTWDDVDAIRASDKTALELSAQYGVHRNYIYTLRKNLVWKK